jgi:hypothetical protein
MTQKEILELLVKNGISYVVIGGVALRLYNSPRVTNDIDIAVRTLDVDSIISLMYSHSYFLVTDVGDDFIAVAPNPEEASGWIEKTKCGSISFFAVTRKPETSRVPMESIDISSQVDFLFELGIPIARLRKNAKTISLKEFEFPVASIDDLIVLKEQRRDKSETDEQDIRFLKNLLEKKPGRG